MTKKSHTLPGNVHLPAIGLGVFQSPVGQVTKDAVLAALDSGYRHIDTAAIYRNERDVGEAIRSSGLARPDTFVTTKLWNDDHGYDAALKACHASLNRLGFEYVDLYLIHWPVPELRLDTWRAMERILADGMARSVGVSNYMPRHLNELLAHADTPPAVNQFELSPYNYGSRLATVELCREHGIVVEAYSPLTKARKLNDPPLVAVAAEVGRTPAQVLIRWALEHEFVVIPKSVTRQRIEENIAVFDFELTEAHMAVLDGLDEALVTGWDPTHAQ